MNKLKTDINGGFPLVLNDFRWWEEGNRAGFAGLASFLGSNCILSGVLGITLFDTMTYFGGYILFNGEVCLVTGGAINVTTNPFVYVELDVTYDPAGLKNFENAVQFDTYEIRRAKLVGYPTAQAGKLLFSDIERADVIIDRFIVTKQHTFAKLQTFGNGTPATINAGQSSFSLQYTTGNAFDVTITAVDTPITELDDQVPAGSWFGLRFKGGSGAQVIISDAGSNSARTIVTGGKSYVFYPGESALFFVASDGRYWLINGKNEYDAWHQVGTAGQPAFENGWGQGGDGFGNPTPTVAFRKVNGKIELKGHISVASFVNATICFTLPVGYRPTARRTFLCVAPSGVDFYTIAVFATGAVSIFNSSHSGPADPYLDPIQFTI